MRTQPSYAICMLGREEWDDFISRGSHDVDYILQQFVKKLGKDEGNDIILVLLVVSQSGSIDLEDFRLAGLFFKPGGQDRIFPIIMRSIPVKPTNKSLFVQMLIEGIIPSLFVNNVLPLSKNHIMKILRMYYNDSVESEFRKYIIDYWGTTFKIFGAGLITVLISTLVAAIVWWRDLESRFGAIAYGNYILVGLILLLLTIGLALYVKDRYEEVVNKVI